MATGKEYTEYHYNLKRKQEDARPGREHEQPRTMHLFMEDAIEDVVWTAFQRLSAKWAYVSYRDLREEVIWHVSKEGILSCMQRLIDKKLVKVHSVYEGWVRGPNYGDRI